MTGRKITILGCGNAALAAAYHFSLNGASVCLYGADGFNQPLKDIAEHGGITALAEDDGVDLLLPGFQPIARLTSDIAEAVAYSQLLVIPVPSFAQEPIFRSMLPSLRSGQFIYLLPGNYGSLELRRIAVEAGYGHLDLTFIDAATIPWATRIVAPATIAIYGIKTQLPVGVYPARRTQVALEAIADIAPIPLEALGNVIEAGLENINFGGHPALTICSMGLLENFQGRFHFYRDCSSPAVARVAAGLDGERCQVGKALGISLKTELEMVNRLYGTQFETVAMFNTGSKAHGKIHEAPKDSGTRYITEDIPYLMVPCLELAELTQTPAPLLRSCIEFGNAFNQTCYQSKGRTLQKMGLAGLGVEALIGAVI
ncbi:MAG: NAD/NADP octopine/nopaline dehydrogenase family protein [Polaromonas sp.]